MSISRVFVVSLISVEDLSVSHCLVAIHRSSQFVLSSSSFSSPVEVFLPESHIFNLGGCQHMKDI